MQYVLIYKMTKRSVPDFAEYAPKGFLYRNIDPTELAVRLGSVNTFNRSGDVIFQDGFESGLAAFYDIAPGVDADTDITPITARNGGFSALMVSGLLAEGVTFIGKFLAYPFLTKAGFEVSFSYPSTGIQIYIALIIYTGTERLLGLLVIEPASERIRYYNGDVTWPTLVSNVDPAVGAQWFNTIKLVIDFESRMFDKLFINKDVHDISSYALYVNNSDAAPLLDTEVYIKPTTNVNRTVYIDDWIVTINEP